ncbi:unknown [Bacteroides sp. CAG:1060]|nr:unknown [Bacteroides sp. CAG:1060]
MRTTCGEGRPSVRETSSSSSHFCAYLSILPSILRHGLLAVERDAVKLRPSSESSRPARLNSGSVRAVMRPLRSSLYRARWSLESLLAVNHTSPFFSSTFKRDMSQFSPEVSRFRDPSYPRK